MIRQDEIISYLFMHFLLDFNSRINCILDGFASNIKIYDIRNSIQMFISFHDIMSLLYNCWIEVVYFIPWIKLIAPIVMSALSTL